IPSLQASEGEAQSELQDTSTVRRLQSRKSWVSDVDVGREELHVVERVECLRAELELHVFAYAEVLEHRQVRIPPGWRCDDIAARRAELQRLGCRERGRIEPIPGRIVAAEILARRDSVECTPGSDSGGIGALG